jgi:hypothetical protein
MDAFAGMFVGPESPAVRHYAITPNDNTDLPRRPRALRVQVGGTLSLVDEAGTVVSYTVLAGEILPFRAVRVRATGTSATVVGWE